MKRRVTYLQVCMIVLLAVGFLSGSCKATPTPSHLIYGLTLAPSGLDPHINASAELGIPLSSVYDTLIIRHGATGSFVPSLAEEWSISPDGLTYTFKLRQDVVFHDGTRFNAEAAVANFNYVMNPDHNSQKAAAMLGPFQSASASDEFTLIIKLTEPFAPLLDALSQVYLGMASPQALERWGPAEYQFHQVGSGPYRFIEYIPNDYILLEWNTQYAWRSPLFSKSNPSIEKIEFRFYEDEATRALALTRGEIALIGEIPPQDVARLLDDGRFLLQAVPIPGQPLQFMLNTSIPPTDDLLVRQALIRSVNLERIISTVFHDFSPAARGALSSAMFESMLPGETPSYDPEHARLLLEESGWLDLDGDGLREKNQTLFALNIVAPPWGLNPEVAQLIKVDWEAIGAEVSIQVASSFGSLKQVQAENRFHALGLNFFGTDADLLRSFFASDGLYNWSQYKSSVLDQLLVQAAAEADPHLRSDLYADILEHISDQALILPVRDYINLVVYQKDLSKLHFSEQGWFPYLIDLELDS